MGTIENIENTETAAEIQNEATENIFPDPENGAENPKTFENKVADPENTATKAKTTAKKLKTPTKNLKTVENKKRCAITANFSPEEKQYIDEIIAARRQSGLTSDANHFVRQAIDFAIHYVPGTRFGIPALPRIKIKDAFYKN